MPRPKPTPLPAAFALVWSTILLLALASILFCVVRARGTGLRPQAFFLTSPLLDRFGDFTLYLEKFKLLHTGLFYSQGYPFTYPAPVAVAYNFFFRHTGAHPTRVFVVFYLLALLIPAVLFARALICNGLATVTASLFTLTLVLTSWPAILALARGNMEILVWIALALATWAWATGRLYLAAAAFAIAAALKLFPFVFFGLFLSVRDLRRILFGAVIFLASSVASLAFLGPSVPVAYREVRAGLDFFRMNYMAVWHPLEATGDHSLFNLYKTPAVLLFHHTADFLPSLNRFLPAIALLGVVLYLVRIRKLPLINQLLCLSIASIYFTAFSGDGTLLHLYYAFALLLLLALGRARAGLPSPPGLRPTLVLLAVTLTPATFLSISTPFDLNHLAIPFTPLTHTASGATVSVAAPGSPAQLARPALSATAPVPAATVIPASPVRRERIDGPVHAVLLGILLIAALTCPFGPSLSHSRRDRTPLLAALLHPTS